MNKLFMVGVLIGTFELLACGHKLKESQVPAATITAFQKQYPNTKASWEKEDAAYEVSFQKDGKEMSAIIDENGTIIETETMIAVSELPAAISDYMNKHYKGMKIEEAAKIVKANGDINYEAELKKKDIVFDVNGNFLREVMD